MGAPVAAGRNIAERQAAAFPPFFLPPPLLDFPFDLELFESESPPVFFSLLVVVLSESELDLSEASSDLPPEEE